MIRNLLYVEVSGDLRAKNAKTPCVSREFGRAPATRWALASAKSAHSNSSSSALSASPKDQPRFNCSVGSMQLATVHLFALRLQFRAEAVEILHRLLTAAGTEGRCSRRANMSDFRYKSMVSAPRAARHRHYSARQPFATVRSTEDRRPDLDPRATSRAVLVDVLRAHKRFSGRRRGRKRPAYSPLGTCYNDFM